MTIYGLAATNLGKPAEIEPVPDNRGKVNLIYISGNGSRISTSNKLDVQTLGKEEIEKQQNIIETLTASSVSSAHSIMGQIFNMCGLRSQIQVELAT
jgi:hypothetical protein